MIENYRKVWTTKFVLMRRNSHPVGRVPRLSVKTELFTETKTVSERLLPFYWHIWKTDQDIWVLNRRSCGGIESFRSVIRIWGNTIFLFREYFFSGTQENYHGLQWFSEFHQLRENPIKCVPIGIVAFGRRTNYCETFICNRRFPHKSSSIRLLAFSHFFLKILLSLIINYSIQVSITISQRSFVIAVCKKKKNL